MPCCPQKSNLIFGIGALVLGGIGFILPTGYVLDEDNTKIEFGVLTLTYEFGDLEDSGRYDCEDSAGYILGTSLLGDLFDALGNLGGGGDDGDDDMLSSMFSWGDDDDSMRARRDIAQTLMQRARRGDAEACADGAEARCGATRTTAIIAIIVGLVAQILACVGKNRIVAGFAGFAGFLWLLTVAMFASVGTGKADLEEKNCGYDGEGKFGAGFVLMIIAMLGCFAQVGAAFVFPGEDMSG